MQNPSVLVASMAVLNPPQKMIPEKKNIVAKPSDTPKILPRNNFPNLPPIMRKPSSLYSFNYRFINY